MNGLIDVQKSLCFWFITFESPKVSKVQRDNGYYKNSREISDVY